MCTENEANCIPVQVTEHTQICITLETSEEKKKAIAVKVVPTVVITNMRESIYISIRAEASICEKIVSSQQERHNQYGDLPNAGHFGHLHTMREHFRGYSLFEASYNGFLDVQGKIFTPNRFYHTLKIIYQPNKSSATNRFVIPPSSDEHTDYYNVSGSIRSGKLMEIICLCAMKAKSQGVKRMLDTKVKLSEILLKDHPNINGTIIGGFLLRKALELAEETAKLFCSGPVATRLMDIIEFQNSVDTGCVLHFESMILYTNGKFMQIRAISSILSTSGKSEKIHYHFSIESLETRVPEVYPKGDEEIAIYFEGGQRLADAMNVIETNRLYCFY
nr:hypothetical protein T07D3.3 - Caenorhabditis elegans [Caenorhabditis elegans]